MNSPINQRFEITVNDKTWAYGLDQFQGYFLMDITDYDSNRKVFVTANPFDGEVLVNKMEIAEKLDDLGVKKSHVLSVIFDIRFNNDDEQNNSDNQEDIL